MSFADNGVNNIRSPSGTVTGSAKFSSGTNSNSSGGDPIAQFGDSLQNFQRKSLSCKDKIKEMRRRKVGPSEKSELDSQIREIRDIESKLKNQLDHQLQQLETLPRTESAAKRAQLGKLQKDFERLKVSVQSLLSESQLIKVSLDIPESDTFARTGDTSSKNRANSNDNFVGGGVGRGGGFMQDQQLMQLKPVMQGHEVDEAIMEERERDIKKMNQDLMMVNEMFKDVANLVQQQEEQVVKIQTDTEVSHERAKAGLEQVQQAAAYQPTCSIS
eukprot:gene12875-17253_t